MMNDVMTQDGRTASAGLPAGVLDLSQTGAPVAEAQAPRFSVRVCRVTVRPHDNADSLELATVGGLDCVVRKGAFQTGDLVAYLPEGSVVPEALLEALGLVGRLAGPEKNRVKAVRLRGVVSRGLCVPARPGWAEGDDVTDVLGVTKHEPPVPLTMAGEVWSAGLHRTLSYDIPRLDGVEGCVLRTGEPVVITEKIHGTWCLVGWMPPHLASPDQGRLVVASKGVSSKGLAFRRDVSPEQRNVYLRTVDALGLEQRLARVFGHADVPVFVLGEVFGSGVQDLHYGQTARTGAPPGFRAFDVRVGARGTGHWLDDLALETTLAALGLPRVPVLYRGPFDGDVLAELTQGTETVSGQGLHVREGVVVRPIIERVDARVGRVQYKSISTDYLLRRGGTERH